MGQEATQRPIFLDPKVLRPLPKALWGHACSCCDKMQSVWELFETESEYVRRKGKPYCSLCWLYESDWGKERREDIDAMVRRAEITEDRIFRKANEGRLWSCKDADSILGFIAFTSRVATHHSMLQMIGGGDES